jgi:hemoglobin
MDTKARSRSAMPATGRKVGLLAFLLLMGGSSPLWSQSKSLYERLGGYDAISAVVEDFAPKLFGDAKVGRFFVGMSADSRQGFMQKNKNLVCKVTGGPCQIISRPAKTTHAGLGITEGDFGVVVQHLVDTLNKFKVPDAEQKELLGIIGTLKPDIVEKK